MLDFPLSVSGRLSLAARRLGFTRFAQVAEHVRMLPYGRCAAGGDELGVLRSGKGTCSSKHRFLGALAHECGHTELQLTVGLYEMSDRNTPGVGAILAAAATGAIPEAHCYLTYQGRRYDFTGLVVGATSPFDSLIEERAIAPDDLPVFKDRYHREALAKWAEAIGTTIEQAWRLREQCIEELASRQAR